MKRKKKVVRERGNNLNVSIGFGNKNVMITISVYHTHIEGERRRKDDVWFLLFYCTHVILNKETRFLFH